MLDPILLIHAFPFDHSMWRAQADFLKERGHHVVTPDLPGFGVAAAWSKEKCSMDTYARYIYEIIQRDLGGRAIVGGLSLGGYVLLSLLRDYPDAVSAAMFMDTRAGEDSADAKAARMTAIEALQIQGMAPVVEAMTPKLLSRHAAPAMVAEVRGMMLRQSAPGAIGAQWAMARRADQTGLLAQIRTPTLFLVGADDVVTPPSVAMAMHGQVPGSMLVQLAGTGHLSAMESPDAVNHGIELFLSTVRSRMLQPQ